MQAIVVLGSRVPDHVIHQELKDRLETAFRLAVDNDIFIFTGGRTNPSDPFSEAYHMKLYATSQGIDGDRIYLEEEALDTIGNAVFTRLLLDKLNITKRVAVVTSCYHVIRSEFIFTKCFGSGYQVSFDHCAPSTRVKTNEESSLEAARLFFEGVRDGDIEEIRNRMMKKHPLYIRRTE